MIQQIEWSTGQAGPDEEVRLTVAAAEVADGTPIELTIEAAGTVWATRSATITDGRAELAWPISVPEGTPGQEEPVQLVARARLGDQQAETGTPLTVRGVFGLRWIPEKGREGDVIEMQAQCLGLPEAAQVHCSIWEEDELTEDDFVTEFLMEVSGSSLAADWDYVYMEDTDDVLTEKEIERGYSLPEYYFRLVYEGHSNRSGLLEYRNWVDITILDENNEPATGRVVEAEFPNGEIYRVTVDENGKVFLDDVPPGNFFLNVLD